MLIQSQRQPRENRENGDGRESSASRQDADAFRQNAGAPRQDAGLLLEFRHALETVFGLDSETSGIASSGLTKTRGRLQIEQIPTLFLGRTQCASNADHKRHTDQEGVVSDQEMVVSDQERVSDPEKVARIFERPQSRKDTVEDPECFLHNLRVVRDLVTAVLDDFEAHFLATRGDRNAPRSYTQRSINPQRDNTQQSTPQRDNTQRSNPQRDNTQRSTRFHPKESNPRTSAKIDKINDSPPGKMRYTAELLEQQKRS